ncbi:bifunctional isocitrate dehydrogenase kinase/phosphatase [Pseudoalteromonas ardens]|uniref:Isocitrate dehydrogenase kinase/phosphatase n=1 Tax=Pseudoalteromonas rubra TaxID=43658 RepID=A0A0L0ENI5_9GAMM|nr:bifunctional isocitrate dehydrogenase kinase/phosphatase [Pseudoalteromonas sp. R96]KNC65974.1 isocitrate dehydrogenase [Pseudoalteromonas rubra]MDK1311411.1 bifunctional isocitrate dehydrogenase kinase/phosphatase [Pseudoalteromonas sp. R96]
MSYQVQTIAEQILSGFHAHYALFQQITARAPQAFAQQRWGEIEQISKQRITLYDVRVNDTVTALKRQTSQDTPDEALWHQVKHHYAELLSFHPQAELAETFFNSVFCRLFHRRYYKNDFIFVETTLTKPTTLPIEAEFRSYFPVISGLKPTIRNMISHMDLQCGFRDLEQDIRMLVKAFIKQAPSTHHSHHGLRFDILTAPFYRNKGAYIVGRVVSKSGVQPFIIALLHHPQGGLYIDALLTKSAQMRIIFGFARAYFLVETHAPSAMVGFLQQLMPNKTTAELYNAIGFHKQGKTEFYRDFLFHLQHSEDVFTIAPGTPGMVMMVFTLPNFPFVFKVIKDVFAESKPFGRDTVLARYQLVKSHDRVGRMADTIEYSEVVIPKRKFTPSLLDALQATISNSLRDEGDYLVIKHLYIERRMTPLNLFLQTADEPTANKVIEDYGHAIKEMLSVNIFPGDMLLKNFGVTKHHRVIFYDYDEVQYLTDMNFRPMPSPSLEDLYSGVAEPSAAPNDVFPQQLCTFVLTDPKLRAVFEQSHEALLKVEYWQQAQRDIQAHVVKQVYPYPTSQRFYRHIK